MKNTHGITGLSPSSFDVSLEDIAVKIRSIAMTLLTGALILALAGPSLGQEPRPRLLFQSDGVPAKTPTQLPDDPTKVTTGIPVLQKQGEAPPVLKPADVFAADASPFTGRVTLRTDVGDGVGYTRGFTYLEALLPFYQRDLSLAFTDVRLVSFNHQNRWEYNLGAGYRWFEPRVGAIVGLNTFYDGRKTDFHYYQQLGLGFELLGRNLEFRTNGYIIIGAGHRLIGDTGRFPLGFIANNNFVFQQSQTVETAMGGVEVELGGRVPGFDRYALRAYGAFYHYSAEGIRPANGVRGRLEAQLSERISAHFIVQNDAVFRTTVTGGLAFHFGAPAYRYGCGRASWYDVLTQRVHRDVNIVIAQPTTTTGSGDAVPPPPPTSVNPI